MQAGNIRMSERKSIPMSVQVEVALAARRRCCLCVFLNGLDQVKKGQIAHLNHKADDARFDNLVWLCLEHHEEFDSETSQSKGIMMQEVREYRRRLYARYKLSETEATGLPPIELPALPHVSQYDALTTDSSETSGSAAWRYPMWQVANEPDFFAYKASNRADGVCLIERIDLPDGRIVVACIATAGNPGQSITNCVEHLCFQVCKRFDIPGDRLVWLEHYDYDKSGEWHMVTFGQAPPHGSFADPTWIEMTPSLWKSLRLAPKRRLVASHGTYKSKLTKHFPWPTDALVDSQ
jgi:hypothetical protein